MGREFMPELEEGNLWIRGTFPINISLRRGHGARKRRAPAAAELRRRSKSIVPAIGRPDDGTDPTGFYNVEIFVPLKPFKTLAESIRGSAGRAPRTNWSRR